MMLASQYYRPPFPDRARWREDLAQIRETGLDAIYLWLTWAWMEPEPGRYAFDDFDELIEEAGRLGLGVIPTAVGELNPHWIHLEVPDCEHVDHLGRRVASTTLSYSPSGLAPGGCTDHPQVQERQARWLEATAARYANADAVIAWDAWNEIRWAVQTEGHVCFCEHSLAAYRRWLRDERFGGDLDALNAAWKRRHGSWEEIPPGRTPGGSYVESIAYQDWLAWRAAEHLSFRAEHLRAGDPNHPVLAHAVVLSPFQTRGENPFEQALARGNEFELADRVDAFGVSMFPAWFHTTEAETGARLESIRSAAGERPFWVCELQGGAAKRGLSVMAPVPADLQRRWIWTSYARGAAAVSFWCWRDEVFGREAGGFGVIGDDGHAEERLAMLRATTDVLHSHAALLESYVPEPACVGVAYEPLNHQMEWAATGYDEYASPDSVGGYLTGLERVQVPYDVLALSHLPDADALKRYRVLVLPWAMIVRPGAADALATWVEAGGTLVVETELDAYDVHGYFRYADERPFAARLGLRGEGRRPVPGAAPLVVAGAGPALGSSSEAATPVRFAIDGIEGELPLAGWFEPLRGGEGDEVLASSAGGDAVLLRRRVGAGSVVAIGTHAGRAYRQAGSRLPGFETLLRAVLEGAGALHGGGGLRCSEEDGAEVQWRIGRAGADGAAVERLLFVTTAGPAREVSFRGPHAALGGAAQARDLLTGRAAAIVLGDDDDATLTVQLDEGGAHVLHLTA